MGPTPEGESLSRSGPYSKAVAPALFATVYLKVDRASRFTACFGLVHAQ